MVRYANKFFRTEEQAKKFIKKNKGGVLYKNTKGSHSKREFAIEACIANISSEVKQSHPYCVAWNIWKD